MKIVLLGTGGYHPNERRHTACVMIPELGLIFDAGTSFFRVPQRMQTRELDIFLSHAHLDHIAGLTFFLVPMLKKQVDRVRVHSAPQYLEAVQKHLFSELVFPILPGFEYVELADRIPVGGAGVLTHCRLNHPGGSLGYRIDWPGKSLAYITDTIADRTYIDFIRGVDLLIHECNFPDGHLTLATESGHSYATAVGETAREAGVGRLVVAHIDPQHPEDDPIGIETIRRYFPNVTLGEDLMELDF
ncbi:MAG: metal-dependent hydrolase [Planctomycetes bacterium]|nr:metal-dependent hydrolase [Planctomycetota bacterium]